MRWYITEIDLAKNDPKGIVELFKLYKHCFEHDPVQHRWIMKKNEDTMHNALTMFNHSDNLVFK